MAQTEYTEQVEEMLEALRINDDALQTVHNEHIMGRSLNDFYNARISGISSERVDLDNFWTTEGIKKPVGYRYLAIYTRRTFRYPALTAWVQFLPLNEGYYAEFGFEAGGGTQLCIFDLCELDFKFALRAGTATNDTQCILGTLMPSDYATAKHNYTLVLTKCQGELYIDHAFKGVFLLGFQGTIPKWESNPPYVLGSTEKPFISEISAFLENALPTEKESLLGVPPTSFFVGDGIPCPPRHYDVYTENTSTKWSSLSVAEGVTINSHPIPIWGFSTKSLHYKLTSTLSAAKLQVYTGGAWQDYVDLTVDGKYHPLTITAEAPIARLTVTGGTGGGTINFAEFNLS